MNQAQWGQEKQEPNQVRKVERGWLQIPASNDIIADIKVGIDKTNGKYVVVPNRVDAIRYCIENAQDGDIIVLAGKGHEDYQEIKGIKYHLDEREVIAEIIESL